MEDMEDQPDDESVSVSMKITGEYDDVISKLTTGTDRREELVPLFADLEILIETIIQMDGGTRSAIAQRLPADTAVSSDAESLVDIHNVLEWYDLVILDEKTGNPGPKFQVQSE